MGFWDRVKGTLGRETSDVKEELAELGERLDDALAKKEREMAASPAERFDMALDDADASNQRLEDLVQDAQQARSETEAVPAPAAAERASHQLLEPSDVSSSPHFAAAMQWVAVEATQMTDPMCTRCGHAAWIEGSAAKLIGETQLDGVAEQVENHPLVKEVVLEDREVLYVAAPTLSTEDVRLLVAAAMADHLPEDWRTKTPPDLSV